MISYADRIWTEGDGLPYRQVVRVVLLVEESEAADLMAGYRPGQWSAVPVLSEDAALLVGVPAAEAIAALDAP